MIDGANLIQQIMTVEWPAIKGYGRYSVYILQAGNIMSIGFEKAYALQTDLNLNTAEIIATYVYKKGLLGTAINSFSTAVGLFNTIVNVILLIAVNKIVCQNERWQGLVRRGLPWQNRKKIKNGPHTPPTPDKIQHHPAVVFWILCWGHPEGGLGGGGWGGGNQ